MKKGLLLVCLLCIMALAGVIAYLWISCWNENKKENPTHTSTNTSKSGLGTFTAAIRAKDLKQSKDFYEKHRDVTVKYLTSVYPTASAQLTAMSALDLAVIFNSLTLYYNCCFQQEQNAQFASAIPLLDKTCCDNVPLPYVPQGWIYDVMSYKNGQAIVESDGVLVDGISKNPNQCISNTPQIPWGKGGGSCGEGPSKAKLFNQQTFVANTSGPAPFWVLGYTILRAYYHPHGPMNIKVDGMYTADGWKVTATQDAEEYTYKLPDWWKGIKQGEYLEVTHSDISPGMAQSQGFWMNAFPSGGTGLFYKIGRTKIAPNKLSMLFSLLSELKSATSLHLPDLSTLTDVPPQWRIKLTNMSGSDVLKHFYGTDDPYVICWKYIAGHNNSIESSNQVVYDKNQQPDVTQADTNRIWQPMSITSSSTAETPKYLVEPAKWYWFDNAFGVLGMSGLMNPYKKTWLETNCPGNGKVVSGFDVTNMGKPYPFGPNKTVSFLDVVRFVYNIDQNAFPTWQTCKQAIDKAGQNTNYYLSRVGVIVSLDEPILWAARILGYDTLQQPQSANSNGYFQWEVIDTRVPNDTWLQYSKGRVYSFMQGQDSDFSAKYSPKAQNNWMDLMGSLVTMRNPFDVHNNEYAKPSALGGFDTKTKKVPTCKPTFTYLDNSDRQACAPGGQWDCCPDAKSFPGPEPVGVFNPESQQCYPQWKNIYHPDNISNYFGQITIFDGQNYQCGHSLDKDPTLFCGSMCGGTTTTPPRGMATPRESLLNQYDKTKEVSLKRLYGRK